MKFGFDIDDTLIDLRRHAFRLYNETYQQQFGDDVWKNLQMYALQFCRMEKYAYICS